MDPRKPLRLAVLVGLSLLGCAAVALARAVVTDTIRVDEVDWDAYPWAVLLVFYGLFAAAAAWHFLRAESDPAEVPLGRLLLGAVLIHCLAALALPHTSNDAFSNLAYGRMSALDLNPYLTGPRALGEADSFAWFVGLRWIDTPSVYGPILGAVNSVAGLSDSVAGALVIFKLELLAASLGISLLAWGFCRAHRSGREATATFVFIAWNPILAWEVSAQAHNDGVMVLAMVAFVWAALARREWLAVTALAAAFYAKFAVAPLLGLYLVHVFRRDKLRALAMAAFVAAAGVALFAPYWAGPETLRSPIAAAGGDASRVTRSFSALLSWMCLPFPPVVWKVVYKTWWAIGMALLGWTGVRALRRTDRIEHVLEDSLLFLLYYDLLATPWFHPWYITWTLPLAMGVADPRWRRLVAIYSALSVTQYAFPIEPINNCIVNLAVLVLLHRLLGPDSFLHLPRRLFDFLRANLAWIVWAAVVFVAANAFSGHVERRAFEKEYADKAAWRWTRDSALRRLRTFGTDDGDVRRYYHYAAAAFGRPYSSYYVRTASEWLATFVTGGGSDPDHAQIVTPAKPLLPYRDYLVEYPPGFFLWTAPLALATRNPEAYRLYFSIFMALLLTLALALCRRMAPRLAALPGNRLVWWATACVLAAGVITVRRYDAVVSLLLCLSLWACITRRPLVAGLAIGAAIASKGVPVLVTPVLALYFYRRRQLRELALAAASAAAASALLLLPALLGAGGGLRDAIRYHSQRPLQIESTAAALLSLWHHVAPASVRVVESYGSINLVGPAAARAITATTLVTVALLVGVYLHAWRELRRTDDPARQDAQLLKSAAASLVVFMVCSKVLSPQYFVWLLPLGLLLSLAQRDATRWLLLAVLLLTQAIYPGYYEEVYLLVPAASALVLARNLLLALWMCLILFRFRPEPGPLLAAP